MRKYLLSVSLDVLDVGLAANVLNLLVATVYDRFMLSQLDGL